MAEVDDLLQREVRDFGSALGALVEYEISHCSAVVRHPDVHCSYFVLVDFTESDKADTGEEHQDLDKALGLVRIPIKVTIISDFPKFLLTTPQSPIHPPILSHQGAYPDRQRRGAGCGGRGSVRRDT
jgi:hypothetical protein